MGFQMGSCWTKHSLLLLQSLLLHCLLLQCLLLQCCQYYWLLVTSTECPTTLWNHSSSFIKCSAPPSRGTSNGSTSLSTSRFLGPGIVERCTSGWSSSLLLTSRLQPRCPRFLHTGNLAYQISSASNSLRRERSSLPALKGLHPVKVELCTHCS